MPNRPGGVWEKHLTLTCSWASGMAERKVGTQRWLKPSDPSSSLWELLELRGSLKERIGAAEAKPAERSDDSPFLFGFLGFWRIFVLFVLRRARFYQFSPCPFGCTDFKDEVQTDEPQRSDQRRVPIMPLTLNQKENGHGFQLVLSARNFAVWMVGFWLGTQITSPCATCIAAMLQCCQALDGSCHLGLLGAADMSAKEVLAHAWSSPFVNPRRPQGLCSWVWTQLVSASWLRHSKACSETAAQERVDNLRSCNYISPSVNVSIGPEKWSRHS